MLLLPYILKLSIGLAVVYLFYRLFLQRLTFYNSNRWYLLGYSLLSFFLPAINVFELLQQHNLQQAALITYIPVIEKVTGAPMQVATTANKFSTPVIVGLLFVAGAVIMLVRLLVQYRSLQQLRSKAVLLYNDEVKLFHIDGPVIPFSFGNAIYVNRHLHEENELKDIIRHEFIHVKQRHSLDVAWSEILCLLNWYNPFAWLIRHAIRQNLEFIADNKVLENGIDKKQYQYLLLKVTGVAGFRIANNFNLSSLKKRIAMMNKIKTARVHLLRFLFLLPLIGVLLVSFRQQDPPSAPVPPPTTVPPPAQTPPPPAPPAPRVAWAAPVPPPPPDCYNKKGYCISIANNNGECVVIIKDKNRKIVKALALTEWNANNKTYEAKYGELLPAPPPPPAAPREEGITAVGNETMVVQGYATGTGTIAPQAWAGTAGKANNVAISASPGAATAGTGKLEEVTVIGYSAEPLVKIKKDITPDELEQLKNEVQQKGYVLQFDQVKYENGVLTALSGSINSNDNNKSTFSVQDFKKIIISVSNANSGQPEFVILTVANKK